ncbi:hypothetical protein FOZ60_001061 [Perkinsus olseni]|uniref:NAD(P)-binding domain-containing protein n=1 Tax=Perkinsus olseni TaxID=32597 RepID=A0A7J6P1A1_PEROL|nr:hypothetical protein FOZ60_001061 [Perkinsus olseni]
MAAGKSPSLEGVSGRLFTEDIKREFTGGRIFDGSASDEGAPKNGQRRVKVQWWRALLCMVVAGDKKGPRELWPDLKKHVAASRAVFLNDEHQVAIGGVFAEKLPWKHFGRKNMAYLYALIHGAEKILDLDDDNIIYTDSVEDITNGVFNGDCCPEKAPTTVSATSAVPSVFNPYSTGVANVHPEEVLWPRGFPLRYIRRERSTTITEPTSKDTWTRKVAVVQTLADHDPDFDAIYRLTRPLPVDFHQLTTVAFLLKAPAFTPLNAQACLFRDYDALWGLYLPVTVHGRVSDIWRSFVLQRLLWDLGASVAVAGRTWVRQLRNSHDYLADFIAEDDVYKKSEAMMKFLAEWVPTSGTLPARLEEVYVELYRRGFVEEDEVSMRLSPALVQSVYHVQRWIEALMSLGYVAARAVGRVASSATGDSRSWADAAMANGDGHKAVPPQGVPSPAGVLNSTSRRVVRVWITGINGMIGSNIAKALVWPEFKGPHYAVFGLVRYRANLGNLAGVLEDIKLTYGDLTDAQRIQDIIREVRPHMVFHFAAQAINGVSFQSETLTYKSNVEGTSNVMQALRGTGARVLVASSSTVYGSTMDMDGTSDSPDYIGRPIPESAPMGPVSPYGVSKAATEMICLQQHKAHGTHCVAVRLFIHVSPGGTEALALQEFCRQVAMIEGGKAGARDKTRRDTTDVRDSATQLIKVLETSAPGEVYNVGSYVAEAVAAAEEDAQGIDDQIAEFDSSRHNGVLSTEQLLRLVLAESPIGPRIELRQDESRMRAYDEAVLIADNAKLRNLTGWMPANEIQQTVKDVLNYWRSEVARRYPDAVTDHWLASTKGE